MGADQNLNLADAVASTLDWWREAGVDTLISEVPRNWLAPEAPKEPKVAPLAKRVERKPAPVEFIFPNTLTAFESWRIGAEAPDGEWPGARIGAVGNAATTLAVIIEAPERDDGEAGVLLSGAIGKLFDRMLAAIGYDRQSIYLVPMCVVRPASGRIGAEDEPALAAALRHHLALVAPAQALIFGNAASRALIGAEISPSRGILHRINHQRGETAAITSFHPKLLLERPAAKSEAWKDLQRLTRGTTT